MTEILQTPNVVRSVHLHMHEAGDAGMEKKQERKPDHEEKFGNTTVRVYFHPIPKELFWSRVNRAIAACLQSKASS